MKNEEGIIAEDIIIEWHKHIKKELDNYIDSKEKAEGAINIFYFLNEQFDSYPGNNEYDRLKNYISILISSILLIITGEAPFKRIIRELHNEENADKTTKLSDVFELLINEIIDVHLLEKGKFDEILRLRASSFSETNKKISYLSYTVEKLSKEKVSIKDLNVFLDELKQNLYSENQELINQFYKLEAQIKNDSNKFEMLKFELIEIAKESEESFKVNTAVKAMEPLVNEIIDVKLSSEGRFVNILKDKISELQEIQLTEVFKPLIEQIIGKELDKKGKFVELLRDKLVNLSSSSGEVTEKRQFNDIVEAVVRRGTQLNRDVAVATIKLGVSVMSEAEIGDTFGRLKDIISKDIGVKERFDKVWQSIGFLKEGFSDEAEKFFDGIGFSIYAYQVFPPKVGKFEPLIRPVTIVNFIIVPEGYKQMYKEFIEDNIYEWYEQYEEDRDNYPQSFNEIHNHGPMIIKWTTGKWKDEISIEDSYNLKKLVKDELEGENSQFEKICDLPSFHILFVKKSNDWSIMIATSEPASKRFKEQIGLIIQPEGESKFSLNILRKRNKATLETVYSELSMLAEYYQMPKIEIALFNRGLEMPISETQIIKTLSGESALPETIEYWKFKFIDEDEKLITDENGEIEIDQDFDEIETKAEIRKIVRKIKEYPLNNIKFSYEQIWYVWASKFQNRYLILKLETELNSEPMVSFQSAIANMLVGKRANENIVRIKTMVNNVIQIGRKDDIEKAEQILEMSLQEFIKMIKNYNSQEDRELLLNIVENRELANIVGKYSNTITVQNRKKKKEEPVEFIFLDNITNKIWNQLVKAEKQSQRRWVDAFVQRDPDLSKDRNLLRQFKLITRRLVSVFILIAVIGTGYLFYNIGGFHNSINQKMINNEKQIVAIKTELYQLIQKEKLTTELEEKIKSFDKVIEFRKHQTDIPEGLKPDSQNLLSKIISIMTTEGLFSKKDWKLEIARCNNEDVSIKRVKKLKDYLLSKNIESDDIIIKDEIYQCGSDGKGTEALKLRLVLEFM